jgi:hypothetical protein
MMAGNYSEPAVRTSTIGRLRWFGETSLADELERLWNLEDSAVSPAADSTEATEAKEH